MNDLQPTVVDMYATGTFSDTQQVAEHYTTQLRLLTWPRKPAKPVKADNESWEHFGKRVDTYEQQALYEYHRACSLYNLNQAYLYSWFQRDVLAAAGVAGHPKASQLYAIAWEKGHAAGLSEVAQWVDELSILLKESNNA